MSFISEIIEWYGKNKRDLPWRKTRDPYIIWLSEIILQHTRVEQGLPYFERFADRFPTVSSFAEAQEDEILKLWQGLGYYSRGRNMHHTAQMVMEEHAGYFPSSYNKLIKLKGVGEYTAAAISSFSANEPKAVVDGNVFRLLARFFGIHEPINSTKARRIFTELANELIDPEQAGTSNQALMEFGSLQCRPVKPDCGICPLKPGCEAFKSGMVDKLPVKLQKLKVKERFLNYIVAIKDGRILLNKRGPKDIWQNLHDFPLIETAGPLSAPEVAGLSEFSKLFGSDTVILSAQGPVKHLLSHQKLLAQFIQIDNFSEDFRESKDWFFADIQELEKFAMPKLIFGFLKNFSTLKEF